MFCVACGAPNADDARFCEKCGRAVGKGPEVSESSRASAPPYDARVRVQQVAARSPGLALVLSMVLPGVGQLYNGQVRKGVITFICFLISCAATGIIIGFFGIIAIWIWAMVDAYNTAKASLGQA